MLASFLFLFTGALFGFVLLRLTKASLALIEQFIWGIPIGTMLLTFWVFLLALALPAQDWAIGLGSFSTATFTAYFFNRDSERQKIARDWQAWHFDRAWLIILIPWGIYTIITVPHLLFWRDGNLVAGWINTWGDWAVHLRASTFFAAHDRLTLESPVYSGTTFHYPYLADYLSAILQRLGLDLARSLTWPTFTLFGSLPLILYSLGRRLTGNATAGAIFTYLVLLSGGLGVYYLLKDITAGHYFWQASAYNPLVYTDMFRVNGQSTNTGIWFMNLIESELFPQRAFLAGIGIALYVLLVAWSAFDPLIKQKPARASLWFAGLLFGTLPLIHTHSFVALGLMVPLIWLYQAIIHQQFKKTFPLLLALLSPAVALGFSLLLLFVIDRHLPGRFIHPIHWWVPNPELPVNPLAYWWRNAGPLIVLGLVSGFVAGQRWRALILAGLVIFVICNFISFQPWQYDNLKLLTYWYIAWSLPIAVLIASIPRRFWLASALLIVIMTGAGLADALSVTVSGLGGGLQLASRTDLQFATAVQAKTPEKSLILAATNHDNPLSLASGRQLYMGYEGWLWTYGIDWSPRFQELEQMYQADAVSLDLIKNKKIDYIALGPQERDKFKVDTDKLESLFPAVVKQDGYELLKVQ